MKIVEFFVKRSFVVNLITGFIILAGVLSLTSMKRDLIPPLQFQKIVVDTRLPGATPEEMETYVTYPIEEALSGMPGVELIRSKTEQSRSKIKIQYYPSFDNMDEALTLVNSRVNSIRYKLPEGIKNILIERDQVDDVFLFFLGFSGYNDTDTVHRRFLKDFEKKVLGIPGVVKTYTGSKRRDIYVNFYPEKLEQAEVSVTEARAAIRKAVKFAPVGKARVGDDQFSVKLARTAKTIDELKNITLYANRSGQHLRLKDIAEVKYHLEEYIDKQFFNGKQGVHFVIRKDTTSDTIDLKPKVLGIVEKFNKKAPDGVEILNLVDGPNFIEQQINVLKNNGFVGLILVFFILVLFLNWKTAVMTSLGLPLAYFGTMIVLFSMGLKIDLLSIIGMILVIGILVDDAIIVSERYIEHLSNGLKPQKAASQAVKDLIVPVSGTVLTTLVAFAPLIFIKSEMSKLLFAVPIVVIAALCLSWLESFFILPNHLAHFVKKAPEKKEESFFNRFRKKYEAGLIQVLRFRYVLLASLVVVFGVSIYIATKHLKHNFNLNINSEKLVVYAVLKESKSIEDTYRQLRPIENFLSALPKEKVENIYTSVGWVWMHGKKYEGARFVKINAFLNREAKYPSELKKEIKTLVDEELKKLKTENFEKLTAQIQREDSNEEIGDTISVRVKGDDALDIGALEKEIISSAIAQKSIKEFVPDPDRYQMSWVFHPDVSQMAQYKITPSYISSQIRGIFTPDSVVETRIGGENIHIMTRLKTQDGLGFDSLSNYEVISPLGTSVPLKFLGSWEETKSLKMIKHRDSSRRLSFDFTVDEENSNKQTAIGEIKKVLKGLKKKYPSYTLYVVEADEQKAKNKAWALKVAMICIGGVLLIIALILGSLTQPFIVGLPIPFGLIGIVLALLAHGEPLGLMALIGLVGTIGVAVNASIVMVDQINRIEKEKGLGFTNEVLVQGASSRLRAIVLTTLTTLGGVFPMAYSLGGESGFTQPLAFSMAWGLSFSTVLTLFALPALLAVREDLFKFMGKFFGRKKEQKTIAELQKEAHKNTNLDSDSRTPNFDEREEVLVPNSPKNYNPPSLRH